ncbi:hypothetical protein BOTBODRAFT_264972 [Botryobasidium botryosum FD-172 SS1]|uniref:Uncharacterized protein n=1 Tax=Botryobasidium botryosum (strain FD-172 SS1) TaxID=930990 RepID=A0A067LSY2_BOTB1|nr:hypothetical protein BOTBODRAFT_264972 [Botryobasidium botryosum FD-172 SS1]
MSMKCSDQPVRLRARSIQQMAPENSLNPRAPIYRLNNDVLSLIFEFARDDYPVAKPRSSICVLQVSRLWRRVALDTPRIWSRIVDVLRPHLIETHLTYSKCALLDICFSGGSRQRVKSSISLLMEQVSRWQRLSLSGQADGPHMLTAPAPHLEELHISIGDSSPPIFASHDFFSGSTPQLRILVLKRFIVPLTSGIYTNLISLHLETLDFTRSYSPDGRAQFLRVLSGCPLLETLFIGNLNFLGFHALEKLEPIHLPHLHHIECHIRGIAFPHLTTLQSHTMHNILASVHPSPSCIFRAALAGGDAIIFLPSLPKLTTTLESLLRIEQLSFELGQTYRLVGRIGGPDSLEDGQNTLDLEFELCDGVSEFIVPSQAATLPMIETRLGLSSCFARCRSFAISA